MTRASRQPISRICGTALVGGATMPSSLFETWTRRGVTLTQGYGLTEAAPNVLCLTPDEAARHPGAVGRPYPHVDVLPRRPRDRRAPLEGDADGELWVRGPSVFAGYLGDPEATARARSGEWLRTGDLGIPRRRGRLPRSSTASRTSSSRAARTWRRPRSSTPSCCIPRSRQRPWSACPTASGASAASRSSSPRRAPRRGRRCSRTRARVLAAFKVPVRVAFVDELPRSTIDKLARSRLRDRAQALVQEEVRRERS